MSKKPINTDTRKAALKLAEVAMKAYKSTDFAEALRLAEQGQAEYPWLEITDGKGKTGKPFDVLAASAGRKVNDESAPMVDISRAVRETVAEAPQTQVAPGVAMIDVTAAIRDKVASVGHPTVVAEDQTPGAGPAFGEAYGTVTILHSAALGTRTRDTEKGDGTWGVMNREGQHWNHARRTGTRPGFYFLGATKGKTADEVSIGWTALALRRAGFNVVTEIDNTGCKPLTVTADRRSRRLDRKYAALRQQRVEQIMGADEPVSAPPATDSAPVSAPPAVAPVSAPPATDSAPVSAPVPDVSAPLAPATDAELEEFYARQTDEALLIMVAAGEPNALIAARARFAELRSAADTRDARPVSAPPAKVVQVTPAPAPVKAVRPVSAPPAPAVEVTDIRDEETTLVLWVQAERATKATRRELNRALMYRVNNRIGQKDNRPSTSVYTVKAENKFKVQVNIPAGVDVLQVTAKITEIADKVTGLKGMTTAAEMATIDA